jgi:hypothetical protein
MRASPPPHLAQPVPRGFPVGLALDHVMGLPVLRLSSSFMHAVTNTPAELLAAFRSLRRQCQPSPCICRVGFRITLFEACSAFTHVTACMLAESLTDPLRQRLQPLRYLHDCSSCYRLERKLPGGVRTRWKTAPLHGAQIQYVINYYRQL